MKRLAVTSRSAPLSPAAPDLGQTGGRSASGGAPGAPLSSAEHAAMAGARRHAVLMGHLTCREATPHPAPAAMAAQAQG